ncbi:hypothetical protein ACOMHN_058816 [Nucella lapillus]
MSSNLLLRSEKRHSSQGRRLTGQGHKCGTAARPVVHYVMELFPLCFYFQLSKSIFCDHSERTKLEKEHGKKQTSPENPDGDVTRDLAVLATYQDWERRSEPHVTSC